MNNKVNIKSTRAKRRRSTKYPDLFLSVEGYKSIGEELELRVAPLTVISGTNSAGKSSFMQPFLIMKQTIESSFDPGALLLFGPNAKLTDSSQALTRMKSKSTQRKKFKVKIRTKNRSRETTYQDSSQGFRILTDEETVSGESIKLDSSKNILDTRQAETILSKDGRELIEMMSKRFEDGKSEVAYIVERTRCFLEVKIEIKSDVGNINLGSYATSTEADRWVNILRGIIHVPGLRGNPEREYPRTAVGKVFPGILNSYAASIVLDWADKDPKKLELLAMEFARLGLTWKVMARKVNDAAVEVLVGRMPQAQAGGAQDLVSIADVGIGVSQTLPVVLALIAAEPGQIVYIEQPEIHLHPRAQVMLAKSLVSAAARNVKVVVETHSSLLIRAIQTEIALGSISNDDVSLNWFSRDSVTGYSQLSVADLDNKGRFGDWPVDFDEISSDADMAYIQAVME